MPACSGAAAAARVLIAAVLVAFCQQLTTFRLYPHVALPDLSPPSSLGLVVVFLLSAFSPALNSLLMKCVLKMWLLILKRAGRQLAPLTRTAPLYSFALMSGHL